MPTVSLRRSTNLNMGAVAFTTTMVTFDTEQWDNDNLHSLASQTDRIVIQTPGKYLVTFVPGYSGGGAGAYMGQGIFRNGTQVFNTNTAQTGNGFISPPAVIVLNCAAGDYLQAQVWSSAANATLTAADTYFQATRIGDTAPGTPGVPSRRFRVGGYYATEPQAPATSNSALNQRCYATPLWVPDAHSFDRIAWEVTSAAQAGGKARFGVYADDGYGYPSGAPLVETADQAVDAVGAVEAAIVLALASARYVWIAWQQFAAGTTKPTWRANQMASNLTPPMTLPAGSNLGQAWMHNATLAAGGLPNPFVAVEPSSAIVPARLYLRCSA